LDVRIILYRESKSLSKKKISFERVWKKRNSRGGVLGSGKESVTSGKNEKGIERWVRGGRSLA